MLNKIIEFSVKQKFIALALVLGMAIHGFISLTNIPINSLPDVTPVQVLVITKAGRYSPYDVEKFVSFPIENTMNGLPDVKEVRSISQFGLSAVTIEFEQGTDIYFARQLVSQRLASVKGELPGGVSSPQLGPISTALGEIYQYTVKGPANDLTELRTIQDWIIAPQLKTIKGVTEITAFGGFVKQYEVLPDPGKLMNYNLNLLDIMEAIERNNSVSGGNYLEHNREQYIIRGFGLLKDTTDLEKIIVENRDGLPIFIRDVAEVRTGKQLRQGAVTKDGEGEVVTGIIMMLRGANSRNVINNIETKLETVRQSLPEGVTIEKFYDQSDLIDRTTGTITTNLLEGGFFVIAVLLLLLGEITGAIIVAAVIPLSMLFAFIGMEQFGLAANLMSLGAIDFGMVVDGSVVMVENIVHKLNKNESADRKAIIIKAAQEVSRPIFFGVLIILMVYVPVMTFSGMEGILYKPMAITVATAVLGSLLLAFTFVPAMASIAFKKGVRIRSSFLINYLKPKYENALSYTLKKRSLVLSLAIGVLAISIAIIPFLGTEFLPELDEGSILIEQVRMPSVTLEESVENANWLAGIIVDEIPEVESVVPKTGRSDLANDWMGVHQTDIWVLLKPMDKWREGVTKKDIQEMIEPYLQTEPGLAYNFTQPIAMRVDELTSGVKSDIAVKIYGEDLEVMTEIGNNVIKIASEQNGTDNLYLEQPIGQPYLNIEIDREKVAYYGINVDDVQRLIETGVGGSEVTQIFEGQRRFNVVVRFKEDIRNRFSKIDNLMMCTPSGATIPLEELAYIESTEGPREIFRESGWRRLVVSINIKDIDIGSYISNLREGIDRNVDIPTGNFIEYGGAFENQQRAMKHLLFVVPLSILIILGLLYIMFNNLKYALLIFLNLPFALSGGIIMLYIRDLYLSISASIGFVALFGVAVLNGIVMISHINSLKKSKSPIEDLKSTILKGASDRLRPVLMTALVASLGFIPMAFNVGPGSEVQRPLASVVIGGLVTSTLLTLFVLPTVYHWLESREDKKS